MLAKVIAWGPDRTAAFRALAGSLRRSRIHGLTTNRSLLHALLTDAEVLAGRVSSDLLERRKREFRDPAPAPDTSALPRPAAAPREE